MAVACSIVLIAVGSSPAGATDYFISSSSGDDSNDGLSESRPFESLAVITGLSRAPGDRVPLKCGDTWRAQQLEVDAAGVDGVDVFGPDTTVEFNHIVEPCFSKGDCGGVRVFGRDNLTATTVHDITLRSNIIEDSIGNLDGVKIDYRQPFGMGLYIDHYARDVEAVDNWFVLAAGEQPRSRVFTNPTAGVAAVNLHPRQYLDLDQNPVSGTLILQPFASRVLIDDGPSDGIFADGFESGNTTAWSS